MSSQAETARNLGSQPGVGSFEFWALALAAGFAFCNMTIFYGFYGFLERAGIEPQWRGPLIAAEPLAAVLARPLLSLYLRTGFALRLAALSLAGLGALLPCYQFVLGPWPLLGVRVLHGLAFVCLVSSLTVLLSLIIPKEQSARGFAYFSFSSLLPYVIMPPAVEFFLRRGFGEAEIYAYAALLCFPALGMLAALRNCPAFKDNSRETGRAKWSKAVIEGLRQANIYLLLAANLTFFVSTTIVYYYLKPFAQTIGLADPGLFFSLSFAGTLGVRLCFGSLLNRMLRPGPAALILLGLAGLEAAIGFSNPHSLLGLAGLYGLCLGLIQPLLNALMFGRSAPELRGSNLNLMLFMMDLGYTLGPVLGGEILDCGYGFATLFLVCGAITLAGSLLLWFDSRRVET